MARLRRWTLRLGVALGLLVLGAGGAFLFLTRTAPGRALVLARVLRELEGAVRGRVIVATLTPGPGGLLRSATLHGVRLEGLDGRPLLEADSISAEYAVRDLASRRFVFPRIALWRPTITIERTASDSVLNAWEVLPLAPPAPADADSAEPPAPATTRLAFGALAVHDGQVRVRTPLPDDAPAETRFPTEPDPAGGRLRALTFRAVDAELADVRLVAPDLPGPSFRVRRLSLEGEVGPAPLRLVDLAGRVDIRDGRVLVAAERLRLPASQAAGLITVDTRAEGGASLTVDLSAEALDLADLAWIVPDLPGARGNGEFAIELDPRGFALRWEDAVLDFGDGRLAGRGEYRLPAAGGWRVADVNVALTRFPLSVAEAVARRELPVEGALDGRLAVEGGARRLVLEGDLTLSGDPRSATPTRAVFSGAVGTRADGALEARGLDVAFPRLDYRLVRTVAPGVRVAGAGPARVLLEGRLDQGLGFNANLTLTGGGEASRVVANGSLRRLDDVGDLAVTLDATLDPLALAPFVAHLPEPPEVGRVRGRVHAEGRLGDLRARAELATAGGTLDLRVRLDARRPFASYEVVAEANRYALDAVVPGLPSGTEANGRLSFVGAGLHPDSVDLTGALDLRRSRLGVLRVDTAFVAARLVGGVLHMDTLTTVVGGVRMEGRGALAATEQAPGDSLGLAFAAPTLEGLRPLFMGERVIARDTLSSLEREFLELEGIDADTLPLAVDVRMAGAVQGTAVVSGSLTALAVRGSLALDGAIYRRNALGRADVTFAATGLPSRQPRIEAEVRADSVLLLERTFQSGTARLSYREPAGNLDLFLVRDDDEDYLARVAFEAEGTERILHLDELGLRFADARWNLAGPATIAWDEDGLTFRSFRMLRPGEGGLRVRAEGRYPFRGEADLDVEIERLDLARVASLLQLPDTLEGVVDLRGSVRGRALAPRFEGTFAASGFRYGRFSFATLGGTLAYTDGLLTTDTRIGDGDHTMFHVEGSLPVDVRLDHLGAEIPDRPIDLSVAADSLPARILLGLVTGLRDVEGVLDGAVRLGGTAHHLAPEGRFTLRGGAATLEGLGVRHRDARATFQLRPDGSVAIEGEARAGGRVQVAGTVTLDPASDPGLDLTFTMRRLRGVARRDVVGTLSGEARLTGSYRSPVVSGRLTVDEGALFLEEFIRTTEIVDLALITDPAVRSFVDTTLVELRPLLGGGNPFLRNILMRDFTLVMDRGTWIRSDNMNVELGGTLDVFYDRANEDLAMVGTLQAVRGTYTVVGRPFQVDGGTVVFVGTPGVNPSLDIQATNRIRTATGDRLTINARVTGTLISPRVSLSSDQIAMSEADLLAYLITGRPSYALGSGQSEALRGAAGVLGAATGAVTLGLSTLSNELGNAVAQSLGLGLDYLAITQQDVATLTGVSLTGTLGTTVIETGRYLTDDLFVTLLLRPNASDASGNTVAGLRLEWALSDNFIVESFIEDRFFRNRIVGFGDVGLQSARGFGLFIFREWGY
ncbi:MAG: translocation/assembly module TamB [Gemmatimonadetes bacterium]|nr:MAG: translocation/assembly module TamB [Gemmatimonadota bacterium]